MRYILGALIVTGLVILLDYSDFFLSRYIRNRIAEINNRAVELYSYKPINRLNLLSASLLFWIPPFYLLGDSLFLEYKIILTVLYWTALSTALIFYLRKQSSRKTARQSLPFILAFAVASGLLLGPVLSALNAFLGL